MPNFMYVADTAFEKADQMGSDQETNFANATAWAADEKQRLMQEYDLNGASASKITQLSTEANSATSYVQSLIDLLSGQTQAIPQNLAAILSLGTQVNSIFQSVDSALHAY